ncbi:MAG: hypothetical protein H0V66_06435 [Bdellovibrionales bacterium]|nr:hypothetical protein [Bdellovibrionales bacterium]
MKILIILLLVSQAWAGNPVKKSDLDPTLEGPVIPGTKVPVEELNTAPTSPQLEEENKEFRNTLRARKEKQKEIEIKRKEP